MTPSPRLRRSRRTCLTLLLSSVAGCGSTATMEPPDLTPLRDLGAVDQATARDLVAAADQGAVGDLPGSDDLAVEPDLAVALDLAVAADLAEPPDLAAALDLTPPSDFAPPSDLAQPADLAAPADLAPSPDLSPSPDLTPPPDLRPSCKDNTQNGGESDIDCGGNCGPCANGKKCNQPGDCASQRCTNGLCQSNLGTVGNPGAGCKAILDAGAAAGDGAYYISAAGSTYQVHCDMTRDGGGWTLMLRARRSGAAGWAATGALNPADLPKLNAVNSAKAADAAINAVRSVAYRLESFNCTNTGKPATVYFKPSCVYDHGKDTSGPCQTFYDSVNFTNEKVGTQYGGYKGLSSYTDATRPTTAVIVHDPVSGLGDDSWWAGGPNFCDLNVYVK